MSVKYGYALRYLLLHHSVTWLMHTHHPDVIRTFIRHKDWQYKIETDGIKTRLKKRYMSILPISGLLSHCTANGTLTEIKSQSVSLPKKISCKIFACLCEWVIHMTRSTIQSRKWQLIAVNLRHAIVPHVMLCSHPWRANEQLYSADISHQLSSPSL